MRKLAALSPDMLSRSSVFSRRRSAERVKSLPSSNSGARLPGRRCRWSRNRTIPSSMGAHGTTCSVAVTEKTHNWFITSCKSHDISVNVGWLGRHALALAFGWSEVGRPRWWARGVPGARRRVGVWSGERRVRRGAVEAMRRRQRLQPRMPTRPRETVAIGETPCGE